MTKNYCQVQSKYRRKLTSEMKGKLHSKLYEIYFIIYNCVIKRKENQDLLTFSKVIKCASKRYPTLWG